jgi:hypothetical protein
MVRAGLLAQAEQMAPAALLQRAGLLAQAEQMAPAGLL